VCSQLLEARNSTSNCASRNYLGETLGVDSLSALPMALKAGLGRAILSRSTVLADFAAGKSHTRRIVDPPLPRSLALIAFADRLQTKAFLAVRQTAVEVVRAAVDERRWPAKGNGGARHVGWNHRFVPAQVAGTRRTSRKWHGFCVHLCTVDSNNCN
jgi:hypothetical protein